MSTGLGSPAIRLERVSKRYSPRYGQGQIFQSVLGGLANRLRRVPAAPPTHRDFWALKDLSLTVEKGESLGIVGPNGAGKSTILKLLSNITRPSTGTVLVNGKVTALIEVGAGFHPELTGRENIYLNGIIRGLARAEIQRKFDSIVEFSELEEFIDVPVKRYSSGMYMRLGFAVAAHAEPDILLIDEILAVGDLGFHRKCLERTQQLRRDKKTIVFVSHNMEAIRAVCDRAILLQHGVVTESGEPERVLTAYRDCMLRQQEERLRGAVKGRAPGTGGRHSKADVEILVVRLLDDDGVERTAFQTGQNLIVQVDFVAHTPVKDPSFAVQVHAADGTYCHWPNTHFDGIRTGLISGERQFELEFVNLRLLPNTYSLTVEVLESACIVAYDQRNAVFRVEAPLLDEGTFYLDHRWRLWDGVAPSNTISPMVAPRVGLKQGRRTATERTLS
ncbi:MAG: ABC transporter ATP-binding protein [Chloroflexi bacterium]|nr:ABC transporter ATP-binding protein [Chloroflexota bacterium]